jgi:hypothetical protein
MDTPLTNEPSNIPPQIGSSDTKVQKWLDAPVKPKERTPQTFLKRLTKSKNKDKTPTEPTPSSKTSVQYKSITNSALKRLRDTFLKTKIVDSPPKVLGWNPAKGQWAIKPKKPKPEKRNKRQQSPEVSSTNTPLIETRESPQVQRRSTRQKTRINYKTLATKGK